MKHLSTVVAAIVTLSLASSGYGLSYTWQTIQLDFQGSSQSAKGVYDGKLYVAGGYGSHSSSGQTNIWQIDLDTMQAQTVAHLPYGQTSNDGVQSAIVDHYMVISPQLGPTPNNGWGRNRQVMVYDLNNPTQNAQHLAALTGGNSWTQSVLPHDDGTVYLFGGWNGGGLNTIWNYNPATNSLRTLSTRLNKSGSVHSAVVDGDGNMVLFSGNRASRRIEIFDPDTEQIIYYSNSLPADLGNAYNAWSTTIGGQTHIFVGNQSIVYEFDSVNRTFTDAGFVLPDYAGRVPAIDPVTQQIYFIKHQSTGYDALIVGTPEGFANPIPAPGIVLGGLGLLAIARMRRRV